MFFLKCIFFYYLWVTWNYIQPHLDDLRNLDMTWTDQAELWLSNAGFTTPPIEDLHHFSGYNIAIAGMVKDAEKTLPTLMKQLEIFSCAFDSAHIFVLESNSEDHTREIVRNWKLNPPDCENVHTNLLNDLPNRIKKKLKHINDQKKAKLNITINDDQHPEFGDHRIFHKGGIIIYIYIYILALIYIYIYIYIIIQEN